MKQYRFRNGLVLLYEKNKYTNLDSFQVNVCTGSLLEKEGEYGINHLIEHLIFKSTKKRTTQQIATELEVTGANVNAWTNYSNVRFYFDVLPKHLEKCAEIYADMLFNKDIKLSEFKMERDVVCQELAMYEDHPDAINEENWWKQFYRWEPVGGTIKSVKGITLGKVNRYIEKYYNPQNMVISVCSRLSFFTIKRIVAKYFGCIENREGATEPAASWVFMNYQSRRCFEPGCAFTKEVYKKKKKTSQVQIAYGYDMKNFNPEEIEFLNNILSDGLSSILYREIREKYGLCYGFHIDTDPYFNKKVMEEQNFVSMIKASTEAQNVDKFCKVFESVMSDVRSGEMILDTDIERVKNTYESRQIKAEDVASYNHYRYNSRVCDEPSLEQKKKKILKMTNAEIRDNINYMLEDSRFNIAMLGNIDTKKKK